MHDKEVKLKSSCAGSVSELHPIAVDVLLSALKSWPPGAIWTHGARRGHQALRAHDDARAVATPGASETQPRASKSFDTALVLRMTAYLHMYRGLHKRTKSIHFRLKGVRSSAYIRQNPKLLLYLYWTRMHRAQHAKDRPWAATWPYDSTSQPVT